VISGNLIDISPLEACSALEQPQIAHKIRIDRLILFADAT